MVLFSLCQSISCRRLATSLLNALESGLSAKHPIGSNRSAVERNKMICLINWTFFSAFNTAVSHFHILFYIITAVFWLKLKVSNVFQNECSYMLGVLSV